ncbi:hypothetical protein NU688_33035 [Variovorax sp. ZS18.2.2]|uniref:hypothetical protein n=1 Tax=Variovorax sp. ZS18.2.2 TaxID=2971255 RepID=UPI002150ED66|nr:hypothetical protein [Variovorax sp. ZS18.2.2]MCR6481023.1 hypothetical protein [Variovorax sp. ZS18.2.2]
MCKEIAPKTPQAPTSVLDLMQLADGYASAHRSLECATDNSTSDTERSALEAALTTALSAPPANSEGEALVWEPAPLESIPNCLDNSLKRAAYLLRSNKHAGDAIDASRLEYLRNTLAAKDGAAEMDNSGCLHSSSTAMPQTTDRIAIGRLVLEASTGVHGNVAKTLALELCTALDAIKYSANSKMPQAETGGVV